jgi:hypothetical protein
VLIYTIEQKQNKPELIMTIVYALISVGSNVLAEYAASTGTFGTSLEEYSTGHSKQWNTVACPLWDKNRWVILLHRLCDSNI